MRSTLALLLLCAGGFYVADAAPTSSLTGWFEIVWADSRPGTTAAPQESFFVTTDDGKTIQVLLDEATLRSAGGMLSLNRKRVTITGSWSEAVSANDQPAWQGSHIQPAREINLSGRPTLPDPISGPQPWVSIMCKFSDIATEQQNSAFFLNMYANSYPGLDHYWREQSFNTVNIVGSSVAGWFTLPFPRSHYIFDMNDDDIDDADLNNLAIDCIAAGDPTVNYANYVGINMMFNDLLDCCAWGGGRFMNLDGVEKTWRTTWDPPWAFENSAVIGHEMGHGFGLPHSSGMYGQTYDNQWDVMSDTWTNCPNSDHATYGCLGSHTISRHKDQLEWIPAINKYTYPGTGSATITLEQLALPQTSNYRIAQIPIGGSTTHFYTVEVRRKVGYDVQLPGEGVIIHEVDLSRSRPANVVDADGNGNTGDAGAKWIPGETFFDPATGVSIQVNSATATGYVVTLAIIDPQTLTISDAVVTEGNAGTTNAVFNVSLSASSPATVSVNYATVDGTATTGSSFSNPASIAIPLGGNATPYPSTISVAGLASNITKVKVTLNGFTHTWPGDTDVLLVGPGGQSVVVMSDAGGSSDVSGLTLTFDDAAGTALSSSPIVSGTYQPTNVADGDGADTYSPPAPPSGYGSALSVFNGTTANGTWSLYVVDDVSGDEGTIASGWSLTITTSSGDYVTTAGTLTFDPGITLRTITVPVNGDATVEPNETFFVNLSTPVNVIIGDAQGQGTITDDDGLAPPTNVVATAVAPTNVSVIWTPAVGAASYRVYRRTGGAYGLVGSPTVPPFTDTTASANTSYFYMVRSFAGSESGDSNRDIATTTIFTDPTLTDTTKIKLAHFTELLTAVNATRTLASLGAIAFTAPAPTTSITVRRQHLIDLRVGLDAARAAMTLSALSYTDPTVTVGSTKIKAAHMTEVRNGTQ